MKKSLLAIVVAVFFTACTQKPAEESPIVNQSLLPDTTGLTEFQQWKEQQDMVNMNGVEPIEKIDIAPVAEPKAVAPIIIYRNAPVKKSSGVRLVKTAPRVEEAVVNTPESSSNNGGYSAGSEPSVATQPTVSTGNDGPVASIPSEPVPAKKEGWSKAAKGTAIGAASGAVLGAIISKKKGVGAVVGGVVGAAGGYAIGRSKDKKDGRN